MGEPFARGGGEKNRHVYIEVMASSPCTYATDEI